MSFKILCDVCEFNTAAPTMLCPECASKTVAVIANSTQQLKAEIASKCAMLHEYYQPDNLFTRDQVITMLRLLTAA